MDCEALFVAIIRKLDLRSDLHWDRARLFIVLSLGVNPDSHVTLMLGGAVSGGMVETQVVLSFLKALLSMKASAG